MELIERYVHAVTVRLPESTRDDVARELHANIEDMLPDDPTEKDVRAVLEKLGNPATLASEYRPSKRYLIGPAMYDPYIDVLKIVLCIAPVVLALVNLATVALDPSGASHVDYMVAFFAGAVQGVMHAFLWVTLVFAILERAGVDEGGLPFNKREWSLDDIPPVVQGSASKVDRAEEIVSIIFTVAFISIIALQPELFGWWEQADGGWNVIPVFDLARLEVYLPAMLVLAAISFGLSVYKIVAGRWTMPLAIVNTLSNVAIAVVAIIALTDRGLWNYGLVTHMAEIFETSAGTLGSILGGLMTAAIVITVLACILDSAMGFFKSKELRLLDMSSKIQGWLGTEK